MDSEAGGGMKQFVDDLIDRVAGWLGWTFEPEAEPVWLVLVAKDGAAPERSRASHQSCGRTWS